MPYMVTPTPRVVTIEFWGILGPNTCIPAVSVALLPEAVVTVLAVTFGLFRLVAKPDSEIADDELWDASPFQTTTKSPLTWVSAEATMATAGSC